ncbi:MAG: hypothetical protein ACYSWU_17835 [Planctomycetota bacterium]|jgi:hypothetical protein
MPEDYNPQPQAPPTHEQIEQDWADFMEQRHAARRALQHNQIDWTAVSMHPAAIRRRAAAVAELERVGEDFEITDALAHPGEGGLLVLQMINGNVNGQKAERDRGAEKAYRKQYKLRVLQDMWGDEVEPGDKIEWRMGRRLRDALGKKLTNRHINDLKRRGEIRTVEIWHDAIVDEDGCITVPFEDACMLLDTRGVHYVAKTPLTGMPERSAQPNKRADNGEMGTKHFWLYEEVPTNALATSNEESGS